MLAIGSYPQGQEGGGHVIMEDMLTKLFWFIVAVCVVWGAMLFSFYGLWLTIPIVYSYGC